MSDTTTPPDEYTHLKSLKDQLRAAKKASPFWTGDDLRDVVGQAVCSVYDHPKGWEAVYGERRATFQTWTGASEQAMAWAREDGWDIHEKWEDL